MPAAVHTGAATAHLTRFVAVDAQLAHNLAGRESLAQLSRELARALAEEAAQPNAANRARVQELVRQAQQLGTALAAQGVPPAPQEPPGRSGVVMQQPPPQAAPASAVEQTAQTAQAGRGGPAPTAQPAAPDAARASEAGFSATRTPQRAQPAPSPAATVLQRLAVAMPSTPAGDPAPGQGAGAAGASGTSAAMLPHTPPAASAATQVAAPPPPAAPEGETRDAPAPAPASARAAAMVPSNMPAAASIVDAAMSRVDHAAMGVLLGMASAGPPDRSGFAELERQRAVAAARGSLDEASLRQQRREQHGSGEGAPGRGKRMLSGLELAELERRWGSCRMAIQAWLHAPGPDTEAAVRQAFDTLARTTEWMTAQGKTVPPAPADLRNPLENPVD
ncbi:hypothetical protein WG922_16170 [Ramlibacter sp. AN1015]|uniref:hypothetical protein n=1 Tax=Ramlibacter sp. AN1015 TaxID=3133428 RepID=UPI0030C14745